MVLAALALASASAHAQESKYFDVPKGDYPHDVAVGPSGEVWYAGQNLGIAGRLNPASGEIERISLGKKSAPHGVIVGPDGAPWFTDGGQNGENTIFCWVASTSSSWKDPRATAMFTLGGAAAFPLGGCG
jgi:virginiamycin B lyase